MKDRYDFFKERIEEYAKKNNKEEDGYAWQIKDSDNKEYKITPAEMKVIAGIKGYNGFKPKPSCPFLLNNTSPYLLRISESLASIAESFSNAGVSEYPNNDKMIEKLRIADEKKTTLEICSPGTLRIVGEDGSLTMKDGELYTDENPLVFYNFETGKEAEILFPEENYKFQIIGTESGTYSFFIGNDSQRVSVYDLPLVLGEIYTYQVDWSALANGEKGVTIGIDKDGNGDIEETIKVGTELTADEFRLLTETVVDIDPTAINRKNNKGIITAYIELPTGFYVHTIDVSSVTLNGKPTNAKPVTIGDYDSDGIPDLMIKFDRGIIVQTLPLAGATTSLSVVRNILHNSDVMYFNDEDTVKLVQ